MLILRYTIWLAEDQAYTPTWRTNYRLKTLGSASRGMPTMVDCLIEVRVIRNYMVTDTQDIRFIQVQAVKMT